MRFIVEVRPAHAGFEKWPVTLRNMAADGLAHPDGRPKNLYHAALILVESDINLPGPGRALMPVFRLLADRARRKGIDRQPEGKYYPPGLKGQHFTTETGAFSCLAQQPKAGGIHDVC
ncbi:hypothetical protein [Kocuria sabuli]|uniref:hypothetical protein n=1 Tax=Kocuria sabuli TaxID=3071448 RepID=UPI0034D7A146